MAEALKNFFNSRIIRDIAQEIARVEPAFPAERFCEEASQGLESLSLMARGRHLARALRHHLPREYPQALQILLASLGPRPEISTHPLAPFFYLPHTQFVEMFGLDHPDLSLPALYQLTQRFTAEFSIRPFLVRYPDLTFAHLHRWVEDPDMHVRRLVSEGTRPRLPWAPRLLQLQKDPSPVLPLLEKLKDDPALYVRRSVANHLNDLGKDHPDLLIQIARHWLDGASPQRRWIVRHALRTAIRRGDPAALELIGCHRPVRVTLSEISCTPYRPVIGDSIHIQCTITNPLPEAQTILAELCVFFVKARGLPSPKVFKLKHFTLGSHQTIRLSKKVNLGVRSTRKLYPGLHRIELRLNGQPMSLGQFQLMAASRRSV